MKKILIKNCYVLPMDGNFYDGRRYFKGAVGVESNKIVLVSNDIDKIDSFSAHDCEIIDGKGGVVMPGLINTHTHSAMTLLRGYADDMPLMDWLNKKIWPFEGRMSEDDFYIGTQLGIAEMILSGTTTFSDMYFGVQPHAKAIEQSGIRGYFGITVMDWTVDKVLDNISSDIENYHGIADSRVQLTLSPHAPYTCNPDTLKKVVDNAKHYGLMIHTHLCETKNEMEQIKAQYGLSPVDYFERSGMFDCHTIAAHGVYLTEDDAKKLAKYDVSIAHNPESNMKLASGVSPIVMLKDNGVNVSLGTDGASSNNNLDMIEELRSASLLQKVSLNDPLAIDAYAALEMATVAGAKALGRCHELGQIKEGMLADIILIDINKPHMYPHHNLVSTIVYSASGSDVNTVIIDGKIIMRDRVITTMNVENICKYSQKAVERLIKEL